MWFYLCMLCVVVVVMMWCGILWCVGVVCDVK